VGQFYFDDRSGEVGQNSTDVDNKKGWLFRSVGKVGRLTKNRMDTNDALRMIKRRAEEAGLPYSTCCHTFRATGITN
jgi:integrase